MLKKGEETSRAGRLCSIVVVGTEYPSRCSMQRVWSGNRGVASFPPFVGVVSSLLLFVVPLILRVVRPPSFSSSSSRPSSSSSRTSSYPCSFSSSRPACSSSRPSFASFPPCCRRFPPSLHSSPRLDPPPHVSRHSSSPAPHPSCASRPSSSVSFRPSSCGFPRRSPLQRRRRVPSPIVTSPSLSS